MRIPYVANPPATSSEAHAAIVKRIQDRRAPRPLQPLDLALLHSPDVADGWNHFLGAVRTATTIADDVREIAISRVAACNEAWYEWNHHAPLAYKAGVSKEALDIVQREGPIPATEKKPESFNDKQWAVLLYTDEMTRNVKVKDETFAKVKGLFTEQEVVEITTTVGCYNMVSRFLVALDVGESNSKGPVDVTKPH